MNGLMDFWADLSVFCAYITPPTGGILTFWGAYTFPIPTYDGGYIGLLASSTLIGCAIAAGLTHYTRDIISLNRKYRRADHE